jgi:hypothetical protein
VNSSTYSYQTEAFMSEIFSIELLTEFEAAKEISVSVETLRKWRFDSIGPPYFKIQKSIRYSRKDVIKYLLSKRIVPNKRAA